MPKVESLLSTPVRKSTPAPSKPDAAPNDSFQDHLDSATATDPTKPTKPAKPAAKATPTAKPESKKPQPKPTKLDADADAPPPTEDTATAEAATAASPSTPVDPESPAPADHADSLASDAEPDASKPAPKPSSQPTDDALLQQSLTANPVQPVNAPKDESPKQQNPQSSKTDDTAQPVVSATDPTAQATATAATADQPAKSSATAKPAKESPDTAAKLNSIDSTDPTDQDAAVQLPEAGARALPDHDAPNQQGQEQNQSQDPATKSSPKPAPNPSVSPLGVSPDTAPVPKAPTATKSTDATQPIDATSATLPPDDFQLPADTAPAAKSSSKLSLDPDAAPLFQPTDHAAPAAKTAAPSLPPPPPEVQFAEANHDNIVTSVRAQMSAQGNGSMHIRLDPPELGALKVSIEMANGQMTATFQTSNEQATQLLSHSLNQLKHVLESQGVTVDRLQVQQAPRSEQSNSGGGQDDPRQHQQNWSEDHAARQEQQRKEMLKRMWRKISGAADPIDFLA